MLMSDGYKRKTELERSKSIDAWRQTRLVAYLVAKAGDLIKDKNLSMYDFYSLPDDPTSEQVEKSVKEDQDKSGKWMKSVIENFRKHKIK